MPVSLFTVACKLVKTGSVVEALKEVNIVKSVFLLADPEEASSASAAASKRYR
jgi:hypothetical protein